MVDLGIFSKLTEGLGGVHFTGEKGLGFEEKSTPNIINVYLKEYGEKIYFYVSF